MNCALPHEHFLEIRASIPLIPAFCPPGEPGEEMYFLIKGEIEVSVKQGSHLGDGHRRLGFLGAGDTRDARTQCLQAVSLSMQVTGPWQASVCLSDFELSAVSLFPPHLTPKPLTGAFFGELPVLSDGRSGTMFRTRSVCSCCFRWCSRGRAIGTLLHHLCE